MRIILVLAMTVVMGTLGTGSAWADEKLQDLIIGKWKPVDGTEGIYYEFSKDMVVKVSVKEKGFDFTKNGKFKFLDDETIEATMDNDKKPEKFTVLTISKDEMEWRLKNGKVIKFKRAN